jgi:hypothetical protein
MATLAGAERWLLNASKGVATEAMKLEDMPFYSAEDFKLLVDWIRDHCDAVRYGWSEILGCATENDWAFRDEKTGARWGASNDPVESPPEEASDLEIAESLPEQPAAVEVPF